MKKLTPEFMHQLICFFLGIINAKTDPRHEFNKFLKLELSLLYNLMLFSGI